MILKYLSICRPIHSIKNLLIFLPPFFGHTIFKGSMLHAVSAFFSFTLIASSVYILNDLMDYDQDRNHPVKKTRVIASGKISRNSARIFCIALLTTGFLLMFLASETRWTVLIAGSYIVINIAYSYKLKHLPICDIFILAVGFVLRVYFGGMWFRIVISPWLFLCVLSGALCFAVGKRRNELRHLGPSLATRAVLRCYPPEFLNASYYLFCGITIVFYSLWVILANQGGCGLMFSIPVALLIMLRYNLILETGDCSGDPVPTLVKDRILVILVLVFAIVNFLGVYQR